MARITKGKHSGGSGSRRYRGRHLGRASRVLLPGPRRSGRHSVTGTPPPAEAPAPIAPEEGHSSGPEDEASAHDMQRDQAERELEALLAPDFHEDVEVIAVETEPPRVPEPPALLEPEPELPIAPEYFFENSPEPELEHVYELAPEPMPDLEHVHELAPEPEHVHGPQLEPEHVHDLELEPEHVYELDPEPEPEHVHGPQLEPEHVYELDPEPKPERVYELDPEPEPASEHTPDVALAETEGDERPYLAPVERESRTSRRATIEQHRSERRRKRSLAAAAVLILPAVLGGWLLLSGGNENEKAPSGTGSRDSLSAPGTGPVTTLLFGTRRADSGGSRAVWLTLLTADRVEDRGSVVYIPAHTAVDVPGRGLQGVGESYSSGGVSLLLLSVENLLGIDIDRYAELPYEDGETLFGITGELTVDVPSEVRVGAGNDRTRLIFVEGPQDLDPEMLARLLYAPGIDGDDIEVGGRHLAFWDALLDRFESDPASLGDAVAKSVAALASSNAESEEHAATFEALAGLGSGELTLAQLPVRPVSAGDSELYAAEAAELANFIEDTIGIRTSTEDEVRVQILNGNGVPGIGQKVARELVGHGFRVLLTGNARELTHRKTLIVSYDPTDAGRALAQRAKELLGVGEVQVSSQQQGIVDLTIVVGKDFLRT